MKKSKIPIFHCNCGKDKNCTPRSRDMDILLMHPDHFKTKLL